LGAAFAAFALKDDARALLATGLQDSQASYGKNATETDVEITNSWNVLQNSVSLHTQQKMLCRISLLTLHLNFQLHCCGTHNFTDWKGIIPHNNPALPAIPEACCHHDVIGCTKGITANTSFVIAEQTIYTEVRTRRSIGCIPCILMTK